MFQKTASITQRIVIPSICSLCHHQHKKPTAICEPCTQLLSRLENPCRYCSLELPSEHFPICGECLRTPPTFDRVITHFAFEEPLRTLLHEFKYNQALYLRDFFVDLMLQQFDQDAALADCIMPIPLHQQRIKQRGFNQAAELAKRLARIVNIPYDAKTVKKIANTLPQVGLNAHERRKNLRQSFTAKPSSYDYVLLIDDLLTTGSTANEVASALKQQGVRRVDVWCCARVR